MTEKKLSLGILIVTMNGGIKRVKKELLPQLKNVDEIIISHQITDETLPETHSLGKNVKYIFTYGKGLSKNRNNALKHTTTDISHICDDDLQFLPGFVETIKTTYEKTGCDVITFQAENEKGAKHYPVKAGKHNIFSVGRISSGGITFKREVILKAGISFDEQFGLGAKYDTGEENIFLKDCYDKGLTMWHSDKAIVIHPDESSGIQYRKELIIARIKVFKRMYGFIGGVAAIPYFTILHYKRYKSKFSIGEFVWISFLSLCEKV